MNLQELQDKRGRLVTEAREALEEIKSNTDDARAQELEARHDTIMSEFDKIDANIAREERLAKIEADAQERAEAAEREAREARRPSSNGRSAGVDSAGVMSYSQAFVELFKAGGDKAEMSEEARQALRAGYREIPVEERAQTTTNTAGGHTIPQELLPEIVRTMSAFGPMYDPGVTREITTASGGVLTIPTVNDTTVTAEAHTEGTTLTDDGGKDVTFGVKQLDAFAYNTEWLRVSKELDDDSVFAMQALLADLLGERLGRIANSKLTVGTGSSQPNGIVTASGAGTAAASTSAVTADELFTFQHEIDAAYRTAPSVAWMFHDSTLAAIRKLKDGQNNYLFQMGDIRVNAPGTLLGSPYVVNNDMAELGDGASSKVILYGDMSKYVVRKVGAPLIGAIQDKDFWPGFGIAGYIRFDGELLDTAAVKHLPLAAS